MPSFIYGLCCPDTQEIRYIGKANDPELRLRKHLQAAGLRPENYAQRWMAKLLRAGKKPALIYLRRIADHENWQEIERYEIAKGFSEGLRLTNTSAGGEGVLIVRPEVEKRRKDNVAKTWKDPAVRAAQSARQKVIQNRPEILSAKRECMSERWKDPEYAKENSRVLKAYYSTPEARKAQSERTIKANLIPGVLAARAAGTKLAWSDPERRQKWVASLIAAQNRPEARARKSVEMKERHKDPAFKKKMAKVMADPEMIARRNRAISEAKQRKRAERLANDPELAKQEEVLRAKKAERQATAARKREQALMDKAIRKAKAEQRRAERESPGAAERKAEMRRVKYAEQALERLKASRPARAAAEAKSKAIVEKWVKTHCSEGPLLRHLRHELYASYKTLDETPVKDSVFYGWLVDLGFPAKKSSSRFHLGLCLRQS